MYKSQNGQAIVEALIAITVLVVGFLGIVSLLNRSIGLYRVTTDNYTAAYLAAEGVELAKNIIDAGTMRSESWGTVLPAGAYEMDYFTDLDASRPEPYSGRMLFFDAVNGHYAYGVGTPTSFKRKIIIENVSADELRVNAVVDWTGRADSQFSVNVEDHFFNWR